MKLLLSAVLSLAVLCSAHGLPDPFTATISTQQEFKVGEDVTCKVIITNNHDKEYHLLKRGTPLEDMASPIFSVKHNGRPLPYEGLLVRRAPPTDADYTLIPPKSSVAAMVDLSLVYGFRAPGKYSVQLTTSLHYYSDSLTNSSISTASSNAEVFTLTESNLQPKSTKAEILLRNITQE